MLDVKVLTGACKGLLTSVGILKPLPEPCKVFEAPYDLCMIFLILWQFSFGSDLVCYMCLCTKQAIWLLV